MIQVTINQADLQKLLNKLDPDVRGQVIMDSLYLSAQYIAGWIKVNRFKSGANSKVTDPFTLTTRSGNLYSSIAGYPTTKSGNTYTARIGLIHPVVYAAIHEYGGQAGRNRSATIPPRPYMRPAIKNEENIQGVINDLKTNIERQLAS